MYQLFVNGLMSFIQKISDLLILCHSQVLTYYGVLFFLSFQECVLLSRETFYTFFLRKP